jgi:penicillin-insensitive murein endopeptidase
VPISSDNRYGYGVELDGQGRLDKLEIDWAAMAAHLVALERAGEERGVRIERVFFTPAFHPLLLRRAPSIAPLMDRFAPKEAWVRHDEHYHVDFGIPAAMRRPLKCR